MKKLVIYCMLILGLTQSAYCGQVSRIELNDGSVIEAEVISLDAGVYTVRSTSLGEVKIEASKIRRIESENTAPVPADSARPETSAPSASALQSHIDDLKAKMTSDPAIMESIAGLAHDPQFREILNDPEIIDAIESRDMDALKKNKKFLGIMNNQNVQQIQEKFKDQTQ